MWNVKTLAPQVAAVIVGSGRVRRELLTKITSNIYEVPTAESGEQAPCNSDDAATIGQPEKRGARVSRPNAGSTAQKLVGSTEDVKRMPIRRHWRAARMCAALDRPARRFGTATQSWSRVVLAI